MLQISKLRWALGSSILVLLSLAVACAIQPTREGTQGSSRTPSAEFGYHHEARTLNPVEKAGREIWYKATAGNARYHTYSLPQRVIGYRLDWFKLLNSRERPHRFDNWGMINDPDCCAPGSPGCPATSPEQTFGMDWCPGDDELLSYVGREGYRDPACDFSDPEGRGDKQDPCDLRFGTSTGALGFRKFPNPRFDAAKWRELNGGRNGTWAGLSRRLNDHSIEPPFTIGFTCGSCHISFNPLKPPGNPNAPTWDNVSGTVGNQFMKPGQILLSGLPKDSFEYQLFSYERPGTTDTSGVQNDQVTNPGTMNSIINLPKRPMFTETIKAWRKVESCSPGENCWCEPGHSRKCWFKSTQEGKTHHILKGGEDSIGPSGAVQRVYINIGSCSEECWFNNMMDFRVIDPKGRNYMQRPFDVAQCRRDCPNFRAIEDRTGDVLAFLSSARPMDLHVAKGESVSALKHELGVKYGANAVERGQKVFQQNCAQCHSSHEVSPTGAQVDFLRVDASTGIREDFLSSEKLYPATDIGGSLCRSMHSNHMRGRIWEQYASETYHQRNSVSSVPGQTAAHGPGYLRPISLISAWAFAPFMHNNAIGPEMCNIPSKPEYATHISPFRDGNLNCTPYDPSVDARVKVFEESMYELLHPDIRKPKAYLTTSEAKIPLIPKLMINPLKPPISIYLTVPAGTDVAGMGGFRHKDFMKEFIRYMKDPSTFPLLANRKYGVNLGGMLTRAFAETRRSFGGWANGIHVDAERFATYLKIYGNCDPKDENSGHTFGSGLSEDEKKALTAFMATL